MTRRIVAALLILALAGSILVLTGRSDGAPEGPYAIHAEPVMLDSADPGHVTVGDLRFVAGWMLTSDDPDFGGISAMALVDEEGGDGFVAVGDAGGVFRFALDEAGAISRADIGALPAGPMPEGGGEIEKRDRDAEAMAHDPATGRFWVGFERANGVWRYDSGFAGSDAHYRPAEMAGWPDNGGPEAMVRLPDGRFLVFSEEGEGPQGSNAVLLFAGDPSEPGPSPVRLGYRPPGAHRITDAALLPDGRLLILNRHFSLVEGVSIIVSVADIGDLAQGGIIEARQVARIDPPLTIDNMEALAIGEREGRTIVWMASDDNFNPLQRTLLLEFELVGG
jgi:hypothetical protein